MVLTHQTNRAGLRSFLPISSAKRTSDPTVRCSKASSRTLLRWKYTSRPSAVSINPYPSPATPVDLAIPVFGYQNHISLDRGFGLFEPRERFFVDADVFGDLRLLDAKARKRLHDLARLRPAL